MAAQDLIVLVADKNMEFSVRGLLTRTESLQISLSIANVEIRVHPERDPGCFLRGDSFLAPFRDQFAYGLILFDHDGCGRESESREALELDVEQRLSKIGFENRSACIVIDPELENWVWSGSPKVSQCLGWQGHQPSLPDWLAEKGYLLPGANKPADPKKAMEAALRLVRKARSSSIYEELAKNVSLKNCEDPAFAKFQKTLQRWFPQ